MSVDIRCSDFLRGNDHLYSWKARRKQFAFVRVDVTNRESTALRVLLGSSTLTASGKRYHAEDPAVIIRKLGEFTWDFLLYSIIDFHPITAVLDVALFLSGPLYHRRLRRQLGMLTNKDLLLLPGETKTAVLAFRGPATHPMKLTTTVCVGDSECPSEHAVDAG
jgi:hypothetical protein